MLPQPSHEQQLIIESAKQGNHQKVSASAGSGKTTTMLLMAKEINKTFLILTYNARLKDETRVKLSRLDLSNRVEAHSYHAFGVKYYSDKCHLDSGILAVILSDSPPRRQFLFDIIIIDEVQDMTPLYYKFVKKILKDSGAESISDPTENCFDDFDQPELPTKTLSVLSDNDFDLMYGDVDQPAQIESDTDEFDFTSTRSINYVVNAKTDNNQIQPEIPKMQLCLFGDPLQNIYAFKDADDRFLTLADKIFKHPRLQNQPWSALDLKTSFRVTKQMAQFINRACLGFDKIHASKSGPKVHYMICSSFGAEPSKALKLLLKKDYKPEDIFVISPSVRSSQNPIKKLENALVNAKYPCFVPVSDDEVLNNDVIDGKVVFSSIHQTKGLERKVVMLYGFDASYFKWFNKTAEPTICSNELYVAMTRAKEHLFLIHDNKREFLPFLNQAEVYALCDMRIHGFSPKAIASPDRSKFVATDLTRHLTIEVIDDLLKTVIIDKTPNIKKRTNFKLENSIEIPSIVSGDQNNQESVSDINGICLPAIYEHSTQLRVTILEYIKENINKLKDDKSDIEKMLKRFSNNKQTISDFLYASVIYNSLRTGFLFKLRQISKFDWLEPTSVEMANLLLESYIHPTAKFEFELSSDIDINGIPRTISGCIDCITAESQSELNIWEFKCTHTINSEHILQVLIYMWLYGRMKITSVHKPTVKFLLLNCLTGELWHILKPDNLDQIITRLLMEKIKLLHKTTDDEFIQMNA